MINKTIGNYIILIKKIDNKKTYEKPGFGFFIGNYFFGMFKEKRRYRPLRKK